MLFSRSSKDRGGSSVRPNVSITPISDSSVTIGDTESSKNRGVATTGIEIIPLGAALTTGAGSQLKSKVPFHLRIIFDRSRGCLSHRHVYQGAWLEAQPVRGRQEAVGQEGEEEEGGEGEGSSCCWCRCALLAPRWSGKYCSETNIHLVQESLGAAGYWEWSSGLVVGVNRWKTIPHFEIARNLKSLHVNYFSEKINLKTIVIHMFRV